MNGQRGISPPYPSFAFLHNSRMELDDPYLGYTQTSFMSPPPQPFLKSQAPTPEPQFCSEYDTDSPMHYELYEKIGQGGFGTVHRARNVVTGRVCAVKVIPLKEKKIRKLINEVLLQSRMCHRNVALVLGSFSTGLHLHIVQHYYSGGTLRDKIKEAPNCRVEPSAAAWYISQMASGLAHIHRMGVIHRDIKESNIFLSSNGIVKIGDFGIAVQQVPQGYNTGYGGTKGWMSPEMLQTLPYNEKTDVWSLGVVIYRLVSGKRPFLSYDGSVMKERILACDYPGSRHLEGMGGDLVARFLVRDPNLRIDLNLVNDIPWIQHNICIAGRRKRLRAALTKRTLN